MCTRIGKGGTCVISRPELLNPTVDRLLDTFRLNKIYVRGAGNYLYDEDGRRYLDFIAQYGAVPFGYNPDFIWEEIVEFHQQELPTLVQPSVPVKAVQLAERVAELAPGALQYSTLVQSGAEAVEAGIKLARSATGRPKIISTYNSFHGKTLGALSATGREVYQTPFRAPVADFDKIAFGDLSALEKLLQEQGSEIAGFIVEPVQGEGGIIVAPPGYLKAAQELCRQHGVVFILDEIQTGLGRTGWLFACEKEQVEPDILLLAKALGGGMVPLGVCLSTPQVWNDEFGQLHSSTFANNNFTCAVGLAVLERLMADNGEIIQQAGCKGQYMIDQCRKIQERWPGVIKEVRGEGLMLGVEFGDFSWGDSFDMIFLNRQGGFCALLSGFLLNVYGIRSAPYLNNTMTIRLEPPLTIEYREIDYVMKALDRICEIVYKKDYAWLYRYLVSDDSEQPVRVADYRHTIREVKHSRLEGSERPKNRFAFLIHYPGTEDVLNATPSFEQFSARELGNLLEWQAIDPAPEVVCHMPAVRSFTGDAAEGWLIAVPFGARQMMELPRQQTVAVIKEAIDLARGLGAQIVGLGAFTSVVTRGGRAVQDRGVSITTGNSYTIAMAMEAAFRGAEGMAIDLNQGTGVVVGATGSIGRVCAILLAERVSRIILIGNPRHQRSSSRRLRTVADEMIRHAFQLGKRGHREGLAGWLNQAVVRLQSEDSEEARHWLKMLRESVKQEHPEQRPLAVLEATAAYLGEPPLITISLELEKGLEAADLIISASNAPGYLIGPKSLKPGAVVCDVARPADVHPSVLQQRKDVLVLEGGLVQFPDEIAFGSNLGCRPGVGLACLSETVLLALEGDFNDYSIGVRIPLETIEYLRALGEKHGFGLAALHSGGQEITREEIDAIYKQAQQRQAQTAVAR